MLQLRLSEDLFEAPPKKNTWTGYGFETIILEIHMSFLLIIVITEQYTGSLIGNIETQSIKVFYIYVFSVNIM